MLQASTADTAGPQMPSTPRHSFVVDTSPTPLESLKSLPSSLGGTPEVRWIFPFNIVHYSPVLGTAHIHTVVHKNWSSANGYAFHLCISAVPTVHIKILANSSQAPVRSSTLANSSSMKPGTRACMQPLPIPATGSPALLMLRIAFWRRRTVEEPIHL